MVNIIAEKGRLILETNSEKRTQQGKKLFNKYLGNTIRFQQTLIESLEQKLKSLSKSHVEDQKNQKEQKDKKKPHLHELPEVQEQLKAMTKAHWENWFNESIPALDNKTPREAAKTEDDRERLEALLLQYERHDLGKGDNNNLFKADTHYLRTELALD